MEKRFKLYYTSDTHGRIFPEDGANGACLTAAFAEYQKDENTLVLDGGDTLQGAPLLRYLWKTDQCADVLPPVINSSGMDYYTLGNHDFNYGYDGMAGYLRGVSAQCLAANVQDVSHKALFKDGAKQGGEQGLNIRPYAIHTLGNGLRIGIVGIVTDHVNVWEAPENLAGFLVTDAFQAAKNALNELQKVENNVDYTICIYHGGFEEDLASGKQLEGAKENIACNICKTLDFDLMLTAHQHMEQPLKKVYHTHVLQLPPNAEKYAALEIAIGAGGEGAAKAGEIATDVMDKTHRGKSWRVVRAQHLRPSASPDAALLAQMQPVRNAAKAWLSQPAGSLAAALPAVQDKIALALGAAPLAQLANAVQLEASGAEVAITSLPNHAVGLPQAVTIGDVLTAYPFPNDVVTLAMPGVILAKGIARSASYFAKDAGGKLCVAEHFVKPKEEHYNYDFFAGVSYTIQFAKGASTPIVREILVGGVPLDPARIYRVVMSDYRATGTGGYGFYTDCETVGSCPCDLQTLLLAHLEQHPVYQIPLLSAVQIEVLE